MDALQQYLLDKGESLSAFAVRIGRSPSTLSRALGGLRDPSIDLGRDVEQGTGGAISISQFVDICLGRDNAQDAGRVSTAAPELPADASGAAFSREAAE